MFDVAIVGAGLAGLTAAYALRDLNIVVLEQGDRVGGRVCTRMQMEVSYDLGAVLAYDATQFPATLAASPIVRAQEPAGIFYRGRVHFGQDVHSCLATAGVSAADLAQLDQYRDNPQRNAHTLPPHLYQILNSSFRDIHFGELGDYVSARQRDALHLSTPSHHVDGNGETAVFYANQLGERLRLQTAVTRIDDRGGHVSLIVAKDGKRETLLARTAIVTTPAFITTQLLTHIKRKSAYFLDSIRYTSGTVVALGLKGARLANFSYIVTPGLPINTVLRQSHPEQGIEVLLVYYAGEQAKKMHGLGETAVLEQTLATLQSLGTGQIREQHLCFHDIAHWPAVGAVISPESYGQWDESILQPSQRVWLAGDYLYVDDADNPMPYGMQAAVASGGTAARGVGRLLAQKTETQHPASLTNHLAQWRDYGFRAAERLAETAVQRPLAMTCTPPPPKRPFGYGDLVPLGILLRALSSGENGRSRLQTAQNYLLSKRKQKLWAFHAQTLITATDSSLVLLGIEGQAKRDALDALEAFREPNGGYVPQLWGHAKRPNRMLRLFANEHWCLPDYGTTTTIFGMRQAANLPTGNTLDYLRAGFQTRSALYFANPYLVDWLLAVALQGSPVADDLKQRLAQEIVASVNDDDTFGRFDIPFSTALAAAALQALGWGGALLPRVQLRLLDFIGRDGLWPAATPFYSTRRLQTRPIDSTQILSVGDETHALSLYEDTHRMITTAVSLPALAPTMPPSYSINGRVPHAPHPRYLCSDHAAYIGQHALPPYVKALQAPRSPAPRKRIFSLTALDIDVKQR